MQCYESGSYFNEHIKINSKGEHMPAGCFLTDQLTRKIKLR
jgi:hypothetical protein